MGTLKGKLQLERVNTYSGCTKKTKPHSMRKVLTEDSNEVGHTLVAAVITTVVVTGVGKEGEARFTRFSAS